MLEGYLPDGEGGGGLDGRHGVLVFCSLATVYLCIMIVRRYKFTPLTQ